MISDQSTLSDLRADFRDGSSASMPIAGMIVWAAIGILSLRLDIETIATLCLYIMAAILPLAFMIDRLRGQNLFRGGTENPLTKLFLVSIFALALIIPVFVTSAQSGNPLILVLGMAIVAGVIWIPYGWAADDPVGLRHATGRAIGCYAAYALAPSDYKVSAICFIVVISYAYSISFMKS